MVGLFPLIVVQSGHEPAETHDFVIANVLSLSCSWAMNSGVQGCRQMSNILSRLCFLFNLLPVVLFVIWSSFSSLSGSSVIGASVSGIDLSDTILSGIVVSDTSVSGILVSDTSLSGIVVRGTSLSGTRVSGTSTSGTRVVGTSASGTGESGTSAAGTKSC